MENQVSSEINCGVVLCAVGDRYKNMASRLIKNLNIIEPNIDIELFTDDPDFFDSSIGFSRLHTSVIVSPCRSFGDKIQALKLTRFKKFIYLDVDTIVVRPFFDDLIRSLESADFVLRMDMGFNLPWETSEYSPSLLQPNTGVIAANKYLKVVEDMLNLWEKFYKSRPHPHDQPSCRKALFESGSRVGHLSPEFNVMPTGLLQYKPRIFHLTGEVGKLLLRKENEKSALGLISRLDKVIASGDCEMVFHVNFIPKFGALTKSSRWTKLSFDSLEW